MLVISILRAAVAVWRKRDSDLGPARAEAKDSARQLYPAMAAATIRRVGPTQEKRTFHSFRHTFAKRALESGAQITWLSRHLGHSSLKVTTDIYGHWERAERKLQAAKMEGSSPFEARSYSNP